MDEGMEQAPALTEEPSACDDFGEFLADARMVLRYAVRRGLADDDLIARAGVLEKTSATLEFAERQEVLKLLNKLVQLIKPATLEGVCMYERLERNASDPCRDGGKRWQNWLGAPARFLKRKLPFGGFYVMTVLSLAVVIWGQITTTAVDNMLTAYDKALADVTVVDSDMARLKSAGGASFDPQSQADIMARRQLLEGRLAAASQLIEALDRKLMRLISFTLDAGWDPEKGGNGVHAERLRQLTDILSQYLLPYFYGMLGACVYVVRRMSLDLSQASFQWMNRHSYYIRIILGFVLGGVVGLFIPQSAMVSMALSAVALSFLVGYGVEVIFTILDSWVEKLRLAVADRPPAEPVDKA